MDCRMDGRVALITGASKGLGYAMASAFASSGATVAMLARRADVLDEAVAAIKAEGGKARGYVCDVSNAASIATTWAKINAELSQVDIVVNNAGIAAAKPFENVSDAEWQADLELKLFAAIRLCRLALPGMKARRWGRIINVLNSLAKAPSANSAPTSVSRAAGMALTKMLASEYAPHNVLVNALLVGLIESDQWVRRHAQQKENQSYDDFLGKLALDKVPMGRVGTAAEFANIACFLCSDAGSYITGTAINVDGGMTPVV
ncbi:MAG: SDR family oxidoreductase [Alphaproteobacteria bacterium]|nr:SDR family oxidoreductase [Alphaproteobacteria bacterium]